MKHITEYRDREKSAAIARAIADAAGATPMTIMEVCGTHTMAIAKFGLRGLLPKNINLISGPGCPVCVTPNEYLDHAIAIARRPSVITCTFGDMMKVPGSSTSLEGERAAGRDIRIVYSTLDALDIARKCPDKKIVFLGVGFETTAPTIAASILMAADENLRNYFVLSANKVVPPALAALLAMPAKIDGFILPGHVSAVIGSDSYRQLFGMHPVACAIAGFEPLDILDAIREIALQISSGNPRLHNSYRRAVTASGNAKAKAIMGTVFEPCDANWRGIGMIPDSGMNIRDAYSRFDAACAFDVEVEDTTQPEGCRCGDILTGRIRPADCALFGSSCTPASPVGACMVSGEGTCAAHYRYGI